ASRPADLGPTAVDASMTLGEVAFATLRMHFGAFLAREHGARLGENPEEVHDMRVASRRLRAAIKFFHDALPPETAWLRREAGWIASSLGEVRDLDVQLAQIDEWTKEMTAEGGLGLAPLVNA